MSAPPDDPAVTAPAAAPVRRTTIYHVIASAIVVAGLAGVILSFRELRRVELHQAEVSFYRSASVLQTRLTDMLGRYEDALYGLRTAFTLDGGVSPAEFTRIAQNLAQRNPGVQAFEWLPRVTHEQRPGVEAALSAQAGRPITLRDLGPGGRLVPAPAHDEYYPVFYVHPLTGNEQALAYNLREGATGAELERARQTRQMVLTSQVKLVQEEKGQRGIVMIWPVYRAAKGAPPSATGESDVFVGFVQGVFRVHDMLETVRMRTWNPGSTLDILFVDSSESDPAQRVLYFRPNDDRAPREPAPTEAEFSRGLSQEYSVPIGGRTWKIIFRPYPGWVEHQVAPLRWVRALGILAITGLLAGLTLVLGRRTDFIRRQVADRTAELTESRRQLSSLLHALPGMAYRLQYDEMKVIFISVGVETLTGHSVDEFLAGTVHFRDLIHPDDVTRVREATRAGLADRQEVEVEYRIKCRDGTEKWVLSRGRGVYADDGRPLFFEGLAIDVTARKQAESAKLGMERRMLESQKLESLGLLAGGIAHDFNNILTGILGNASLARLKLAEDSPAIANVTKIELASARAAELCQQMLSYSGKSTFVIGPVELSRLVQETLPLLNVSLASRARLHLELSPRPTVALGDATQIRQIVMNLVINAADAMGEQTGDIYVTTGIREFAPGFVHAAREGTDLPGGEYVFLEVRDNGCGMTPDTMARIFDPFFTTKFAGRGLGLAAVRGIVRGHNGALHVASQPGRGSTFTLLLPPSSVAEPGEREAAPVGPATYTGNALVVDDEAPVREAAAELLRTFGFNVVTAQDGAEGIAQFALNPSSYTLVMLDLTMPTLSGEETLSTLRAISPDIRVLLISGYSESSQLARLAGAGGLRFMQKPFTRDELERKLRELLD